MVGSAEPKKITKPKEESPKKEEVSAEAAEPVVVPEDAVVAPEEVTNGNGEGSVEEPAVVVPSVEEGQSQEPMAVE